jgi:hypothetical protein
MKSYLILVLAVTFLSCNDGRNSMRVESDQQANYKEVAMMAPAQESESGNTMTIDRKLIRNGHLEFKTDDVKKVKVEIEKISKELNGYISDETENNYDARVQYNQTIRVPTDQFDALIASIEKLADKVENKGINTQDVTEEFIDVEARLKTKKELEARYSEILKQAKTVSDIISIESQIANVRAEIESMTGRLNYLKNQVSFSTLNVSYYQVLGTDFGFASKFVQSLKDGWDNLLSFLIGMVSFWPFVLGGAIIIFWWIKRRRAKQKS